jgi:hypothetical protein
MPLTPHPTDDRKAIAKETFSLAELSLALSKGAAEIFNLSNNK